MKISWKKVYSISLFLVFLLSLPGLSTRWAEEGKHSSVAVIVDWQQVEFLAKKGDEREESILQKLVDAGARGMIVGERTGDELKKGSLPVWYGSTVNLAEKFRSSIPSGFSGTALVFSSSEEFYDNWLDFIKIRFPQSLIKKVKDNAIVLFPFDMDALADQGILPDLQGLKTAKAVSLPVIYRPAPYLLGKSDRVALSTEFICELYPNVVGLAPSGEIVAGYPDLDSLSRVVKDRNLFLAQVEFSRQIGSKKMQWLVWPRLLSLHSVTDKEVLSRNINRKTMIDRMVRASVERSVSLLLFRVDPMADEDVQHYSSDILRLRSKLVDLGVDDRWPVHMTDWSSSPTGALAMSIVFVLLSLSLFRRIFGNSEDKKITARILLAGTILSVMVALAVLKVSLATRMIGAFTTALVAAEATLMALTSWKKPGRAVILAPILAVIGGLSVASFYSAPLYMMRMVPFSGVKLTLFLPILIVLFHDLHRRVHPESLGDILRRPPLWGELFLCGFLLMAAAFMVFRSGNVSFVPGWEVKMRDMLEQLLVARPRTKEVFLGYPCLFLWFAFRKSNLCPGYREIFRLGTTVAFSSIVNSFCHFHTRLYFILWRVFNGWWSGMLVGVLVLCVFKLLIYPVWKRFGDKVMS